MINNRLLYQVTEQAMNGSVLSTGLAMDVELGSGWVGYFTSTRGRRRCGVLLDDTPDGFTFEPQGDDAIPLGKITFTVLTAAQYDLEWRAKVTKGVPSFRTDADLHEWYRRKFGGSGYHY